MHILIKRLSLATLTVLFAASLGSGSALAAKPVSKTSTPSLGNDISWPQCGSRLPTGQAFAIVGVNDGLANTTNPCLSDEFAWAAQSNGSTNQPKVSLYVNTANPGLTGSWWPTSNIYEGTTVNSSYGTCDGSDTAACAYVYGYAKAYDDATIRGVSNPGTYRWWLDVETVNSWEGNQEANRAALEGMTAYFQSIGATVGLYSTSYQWSQIAGTVPASSNLNSLQSWLPGARSESAAQANCKAAPLTPGGIVTLTQFISRNVDYDYSCI